MGSKLRSAVMTIAILASFTATALASGLHTPGVVRVGTYMGVAGQYSSVQAAVRAAHAGDWVLVGPGDYKEEGFHGMDEAAGVLIETARLHLRGMNRNTVIIDGTQAGTRACSAKKADQTFTPGGMNGVVAFKVDGVSIENLTTCNYLTGTHGGEGNEIWWNGGDGTGKIAMGPYSGNYITATSTYSNGTVDPKGQYGIFSSNVRGPGVIDHSYASNMGDAAYYIGACPDCGTLLTHAHAQFSALGYSGTNSGGHLIIEHSEFDHNMSGAVSNSQNNDDAPSPQNGLCPKPTEISAAGTNSCNIWRFNYFHDNNNPNVPGAGAGGLAGQSPVGSGMVLAGTEFITVLHNHFANNGSWGILVADLPDQEDPPKSLPNQNCNGGISILPSGAPAVDPLYSGGALCYFQAFGNDVRGNTFTDNGFFKNPGNGDIGVFGLPHNPGNCFSGNTDPAGLTATPPAAVLQSDLYACDRPSTGDLTLEALQGNCATHGLLFPCPDTPLTHYPQTSTVTLHMPPPQPTMPNPCKGVPANPWCPGSQASSLGGARASVLVSSLSLMWLLFGSSLIRRQRSIDVAR